MANRCDRVGPSATAFLLLSALAVGGAAPAGRTEGVLRDGFESDRTSWRIEKTDAEVQLFAHDRSGKAVREGRSSEHFQFVAGPGGDGFYVSYALPKIPIDEALRVGLQVRSDRSGVQLLGRVILPADVDPDTNKPSFVLIPGAILEAPGRWQRLELRDIPLAAERRARVLRAGSKRQVSLEGAYIDRLVVNLYGGPGPTEVFLDELRVEPVPAATAEAFDRSARARDSGELPPLPGPSGRTVSARDDAANSGPRRQRRPAGRGSADPDGPEPPDPPGPPVAPNDRPRPEPRPGEDPPVRLRCPGHPRRRPGRGHRRRLADWPRALMPEIDPGPDGAGLDPNRVRQIVGKFPAKDSVAFWSLGRGIGGSISLEARNREHDRVVEAAHALRELKGAPGLSTGEVVGSFRRFARVPDQLDVLGVRPFGWGSTQQPNEFSAYLQQRHDLTALDNGDALYAAWISMSPDRAVARATWGLDRPPSWGVPRVQPDQLRQMVYLALSAGCRAIGFDADIDLTRGAGHSLLIEAALLNEEIDLIEWLLADTAKSAQTLPTYRPDIRIGPAAASLNAVVSRFNKSPETPPHESIRAASFGTKDRRGALLLVADLATDSQFQPPQMALKELNIDVPGMPDEAIAYEISPGDVRVISSKRTPGGIKLVIPEFNGTAIIYISTDGARISEIQRAIAGVRPVAVNLLIEQAQATLATTLEVHRLLYDDGHKLPDANPDEILDAVTKSLKTAQEAQEALTYDIAWLEATRARRGLAHLMRLHWEAAVADFTKALTDPKQPAGPTPQAGFKEPTVRPFSPVWVPPLTSFATLPQAYVWKDWIVKGKLSQNLLPSGNFEDPDALVRAGWVDEGYQSEDNRSEFVVMPEKGPKMIRRVLKLSGPPADAKRGIDALAPFLDHPVAAVRTPPMKVYEREFLRIAVQVDMPTPCAPGAGGVYVRDSIGGEALQFRSTMALPGWQEVVLYRRVPADGELTVLLGYGGHNFARFDNLRIQKAVSVSPGQLRPPPSPPHRPRHRPGRR